MTPEDAQGQPEPTQSAETPAAEATQGQTGPEGTQEAEAEFSPDQLPEEKRKALLKWADKVKAEYHRQEITRAGNLIAKVPQHDRERLKGNPNLIAELEAERDAFRRAAMAGGPVGPSADKGVAKQEDQPDDIERDVREMLASQGYKPEQEGYDSLLRYEIARLKKIEERQARKQKALPDVDKVVSERLTAKQLEQHQQEVAAQSEDVKASPEWNDPNKGAEFEGRFWRKIEQYKAEGKRIPMPAKIYEEVKNEMFPQKSAPRVRVSSGETSSGKVAASAGTDPFAALEKEIRAAGGDPDKF